MLLKSYIQSYYITSWLLDKTHSCISICFLYVMIYGNSVTKTTVTSQFSPSYKRVWFKQGQFLVKLDMKYVLQKVVY